MARNPLEHTNFSSAKRMSRRVRNSTIHMPNSRNESYLNAATGTYARSRRTSKKRYSSGRMRRNSRNLPDLRPYLPFIGIIIAIILLVVLVVNLVRSCSPAPEPLETQTSLTKTLEQATGTTPTATNETAKVGSLRVRANTALNYDALIAQIAEETTSATERKGVDSGIVYSGLALSMRSMEAANFVAGLSDSTHETLGFSGTVPANTCPALYQWDERWGYSDYCGMPLGFSGCGVTTMAMARMGLTGKTDMSPADMATLSVEQNEADGGTNSTFFTNESVIAATGVRGTRSEYVSSDVLTSYLSTSGTYVAMHMRANTLAGGGHWVLAVGLNEDGTIQLNDPNSPANTAKAWDVEELVGYSDALIALRAEA